MNTKGVNFQPSKRGQFSAAVDMHAVTPEGQERSRIRCMELTEALVTEDITPFERERLREALEDEVRR